MEQGAIETVAFSRQTMSTCLYCQYLHGYKINMRQILKFILVIYYGRCTLYSIAIGIRPGRRSENSAGATVVFGFAT